MNSDSLYLKRIARNVNNGPLYPFLIVLLSRLRFVSTNLFNDFTRLLLRVATNNHFCAMENENNHQNKHLKLLDRIFSHLKNFNKDHKILPLTLNNNNKSNCFYTLNIKKYLDDDNNNNIMKILDELMNSYEKYRNTLKEKSSDWYTMDDYFLSLELAEEKSPENIHFEISSKSERTHSNQLITDLTPNIREKTTMRIKINDFDFLFDKKNKSLVLKVDMSNWTTKYTSIFISQLKLITETINLSQSSLNFFNNILPKITTNIHDLPSPPIFSNNDDNENELKEKIKDLQNQIAILKKEKDNHFIPLDLPPPPIDLYIKPQSSSFLSSPSKLGSNNTIQTTKPSISLPNNPQSLLKKTIKKENDKKINNSQDVTSKLLEKFKLAHNLRDEDNDVEDDTSDSDEWI
jgi:hypothetical protein